MFKTKKEMSPILKTYATNHHSPSCLFYPTIPFLGFSAPGQSRGDCLLTHGRAFLRRKSSRPRGSRRSTDLDGVPYVGSDVSVSSFGTRTPGALPVAAVRPRGPGWCSAAVVCARFSGCVFFFFGVADPGFPSESVSVEKCAIQDSLQGTDQHRPKSGWNPGGVWRLDEEVAKWVGCMGSRGGGSHDPTSNGLDIVPARCPVAGSGYLPATSVVWGIVLLSFIVFICVMFYYF